MSENLQQNRRNWLTNLVSPNPQTIDINDVKIKSVETFVLQPAGCFVKITADNGVVGWGEADADNPPVAAAFIHNGIKQEVIGESVWDAERLWDKMFYANHDLGPGGILANSISGIDIALWDLRGKLLGLPVNQLLGGRYRDKLRVYGSFGIGFGRLSVEDAVKQAKKFVDLGFTAVKLRIQIRQNRQNPNPDPTLEYARAVRKAIGDKIDYWVDINNGYTAARAIQMEKILREELGVIFFEEPVSDQTHTETAEVVRAVDSPVIQGEKEYTRWQMRELMIYGNPDVLNPDPIKAGGLTEMKKIAAIAQAYGKPIMCHNTRPTLSTAATLHYASSISNAGMFIEYVDITSERYKPVADLMKTKLKFENGYLFVPEGVGLGVEMDEERLKREAVK